ncbi:putative glycosyl hydrolase family 76 protein [Phaeomoniella chlamydospora]|uniref:mannan endo-1,6-alpha-mannosidase n=1 Tax=Phaeomoniella chlamydospora TaxID=158046 RepID=A0A0G2GBE7_PHACM|nr:putative glycosyl hydrolase family 76 protein [Phaeomoniella chlamydospora]
MVSAYNWEQTEWPMDAAESNFPAPESDEPSWLSLAVAVFNFQASEWDTKTCGGGLRWQVFQFNQGYNLKNTISNGGFFQLAARLARYTGNDTYAQWAEKTYDWMASSPLMTNDGGALTLWDNSDANNNCSDVSHLVWTYNAGTMIAGASYMYNYTNGSDVWAGRLTQLINGTSTYFPTQYGSNVMSEVECEVSANCNSDQSSYKAYLSRWLAVCTQLAPFTATEIQPKLYASAQGAAAQCIGGTNGRMCGRRWYSTTWDGSSGVGQQMSALSVIGANLMKPSIAPLSANTGGSSKADESSQTVTAQGGGGSSQGSDGKPLSKITTKDRAGAGILTILATLGIIAASVWLIWE